MNNDNCSGEIIGFESVVLDVDLISRQNALQIFLVVEEHRIWTFRESDHSQEANKQYAIC